MSTSTIRHFVHGAGTWFPGDGSVLRAQIKAFMARAAEEDPVVQGPILGGIAPHAGLQYSGRTAASTFHAIVSRLPSDGEPDAVIILGFCHRQSFDGFALMDVDALVSPLGESCVARGLVRELCSRAPCIQADNTPHRGEHSAENLVPFIQYTLPNVPMVIGLFGGHVRQVCRAVAEALRETGAGRRLLLLASTDLLHDADEKRVGRTDRVTLQHIAARDTDALLAAWQPGFQVCCGISPVTTLLDYLDGREGVLGHRLSYRNSGEDYPEMRGQWVVGYGAVVFTEPG